MADEYEYEVDKYGRKVLVKIREVDQYAIIQESLEETKIENMLARAMGGDPTVFKPDGIYADVSTMPTNMIEARQQIQKLENLWAQVPIDIKAKYNNSVEDFISQAGTENWLKDMNLLPEEKLIEQPKTEAPKAKELGQVEGGANNE